MYDSVGKIAQKIHEEGGHDVANILLDLFKNPEDIFGRDFEPDIFIDELFRKNGGYESNIRDSDLGNHGVYGSAGGINIIPSNGIPGSCCSVCISFATKGFSYSSRARIKTKKAFNEVMLMQSAYWFGCMGINVENLILTPDWNQQAFESNYQPIIDNYCNVHGKKVFVVEVSKVGLILRFPY
jgi:hypothetical protein